MELPHLDEIYRAKLIPLGLEQAKEVSDNLNNNLDVEYYYSDYFFPRGEFDHEQLFILGESLQKPLGKLNIRSYQSLDELFTLGSDLGDLYNDASLSDFSLTDSYGFEKYRSGLIVNFDFESFYPNKSDFDESPHYAINSKLISQVKTFNAKLAVVGLNDHDVPYEKFLLEYHGFNHVNTSSFPLYVYLRKSPLQRLFSK